MSSGEKLFSKILVANRGEIAVRVMKTCKRLGIKTVAVYSDADARSLHVRMADEAVHIGPAASTESYLVAERILQAAKDTGAEAIHPGYGFLSENRHFAQDLRDAGIAFIGPSPEAIDSMGDKIMSMRIAQEAGVSCAPRFDGEVDTAERALEIAEDIGYPIIMKASAGGGGKGMRIAWSKDELEEGFRLAREEAAASFGDDRMLIQRFVCPDGGRHIEIQLVGDSHGNVLALPERECSIQRRNQKVIEESPSMLLNEETRKSMQEQAASLAKLVGYESAGTVEFICDDDGFYFLEMNTRLQVEHPVTELITGVDLVEQMIRVAAGHPLPAELLEKDWSSLDTMDGWALESRVYAEDPRRGFLPSIGTLTAYEEPVTLPGVRCDSGIVEGSEISMFYDPMISKLCTHGATRDEAIARMSDALNSYIIRGLNHNGEFLQDLYKHPRFIAGDLNTNFIEKEYPDGFDGIELSDLEIAQIAAVGRYLHDGAEQQDFSIGGGKGGPGVFDDLAPMVCTIGSRTFDIRSVVEGEPGADVGPHGDRMVVREMETIRHGVDELKEGAAGKPSLADPVTITVEDLELESNNQLARATIDGADFTVQCMGRSELGFVIGHSGSFVDVSFETHAHHEMTKFMLPQVEIDRSMFLLSPMPGALVSVDVEVGDEVQPGQSLAVVEAMKMQNVLRAEKRGVVAGIEASPGDTLQVDEVILRFAE